MSHFAVLVIGEDPKKQLAPFHEFECTGRNDEFVVDVDITAEVQERVDNENETLMEALDYYGLIGEGRIVEDEEYVDKEGEHKYGYAIVEDGVLVKAVNRTNADKYLWLDEDNKVIATTYGNAILPFVQEDPDCRGSFLLDEKRRLVQLLQNLHESASEEKEAGAASSAEHKIEVRDDCGGIQSPNGSALTLRDLLISAGDAYVGLCGGPSSPDRENSRPSLRELQLYAEVCQRRNIYLKECNSLSGKTLRKVFVSGAKWDWYEVGGRWTGFFKLTPAVAEACDGVGGPGLMTRTATIGHCNQTKLKNIDVEGMRKDAADDAAIRYDLMLKACGYDQRQNEASPWVEAPWKMWREIEALDIEDIDKKRDTYNEQDTVKKITMALRSFLNLPKEEQNDYTEAVARANVDSFACTRDEYIARARAGAFCTFAVVKDGKWYERGEMGWWGVVTDEKNRDEWENQFATLIDGLDPETLMTVVDCHI
jgi:hypothetical protein